MTITYVDCATTARSLQFTLPVTAGDYTGGYPEGTTLYPLVTETSQGLAPGRGSIMRRKLWVVLVGTSLLIPIEANAQRGQNRGRTSVQRVPAVSGRLAECRPPAGARPFDCSARIVYSSRAYGSNRPGVVWARTDWGRVRIRTDFRRGRWGVLNQRQLRDVLGRRTLDRVRDVGRKSGLRGSLRGRWHQAGRSGDVLVVTMGGREVAEFVDYNRDGFVDEVLVPRNVRGRRVASRVW